VNRIDPKDYPSPNTWMYRASGFPVLTGGNDNQLTMLRAVFEAVAAGTDAGQTVSVPNARDSMTIEAACSRLQNTGLVTRREKGKWLLSDAAVGWLQSEDDLYLIACLHANVRFVGELLQAIGEGTTHGDLLAVATDQYLIPWQTVDQVRRRTTWLRAANLIELKFDNTIVTTEQGRRLLKHLDIAEPSALVGPADEQPPQVPDLPDWLGEAIASLGSDALSARKSVIGYIPGSGEDIPHTLEILVGAFSPEADRDSFEHLCADMFGISPSSTAGALSMLRGAGFIEQTALDRFQATETGRLWTEAADPLALAVWLHVRFQCFLELVHILERADRPKELASIARTAYGMHREDVGEIRKRLQLLRSAGLVRETAWGRYAPTPLGRAVAAHVPTQEAVASMDSTPSPDGQPVEPQSASLASQLKQSSRDSLDPDRFERTIAQCFQALGFEARWLGGSGRTDVLLDTVFPSGRSYRVIVDGKSTANGPVTEGQLNFDTLKEHKTLHQAEYVVVVGPAFQGERLLRRASTHGVLLLTVDDLTRVLIRHEQFPLPPEAYKELFGQAGACDLGVLEPAWADSMRAQRVMTRVLYQLSEEANSSDPITAGSLSVQDLYLILRSEMDNPPTPEELRSILEFLSSSPIGAIEHKQGRFLLVEDPAVTALRLAGLADAAAEASGGTDPG